MLDKLGPIKVSYKGVLIERICEECDSVNTHFEGDTQCTGYRPGAILPDCGTFELLVKQARRIGWPNYYTSDLHRDYLTLKADQPEVFLWLLRSSGTHLLIDDGQLNVAFHADLLAEMHPEGRWYVYWRGTLWHFGTNVGDALKEFRYARSAPVPVPADAIPV